MIQEFLQIKINDPFIPVLQILSGFGNRRVTTTPRSETVATLVKRRFIVRAKHLMHCLPHDSIDHIGYAKATLSTARLGEPHAADIPRSIAAVE